MLDATSGKPISGAIVTLNGGPQRAPAPAPPPGTPPQPPPQPPRILTDSEGRFAFRSLTRGTYNLSATKSGYASGAYGRTRPEGPTRPLQLDDNERMSDATLRLFKYGSIAGIVTDEAGEPIVGAQVRAERRIWRAGRRALAQASSTSTDDRGMYRLFNLPPGEFVVSVPIGTGSSPATAVNTPEARQNLSSTSQILTAFTGGSGGIQASPDSRFLLQTVNMSNAAVVDGAGRWRAYTTTYYPGSLTTSGAEAIAIGSGEDRTGVDFSMRYMPASSVSGVLVGPNGPAAQYALRLVPTETGTWTTDREIASATTDASGAFSFLAVPAGQYVIETARLPRQSGSEAFYFNGATVLAAAGAGRATTTPPPPPPDPLLWAMAPVTVGDADVSGVGLTLTEGLTVSGRLEFSGSRPRPDPQRLAQVPIVIESADGVDPTPQIGPPSRVLPDGRFVSAQLVPGKYFVRVGGAPAGFIVQSITVNGADATEAPIELASSVTNVVITFTDLISSITGAVRGIPADADAPAVILFPADMRAWKDFGINPSRLKLTRAGVQSGGFSFGSLAGGDYFAIAIRDEYSADWMNPGFLEVLSHTAQRFTLAPGEKRVLDLTLSDAKPPTIGRYDGYDRYDRYDRSGTDDGTSPSRGGPFVDAGAIASEQQAVPQTVRDNRPPEVAGTASISGVVTISDGSVKPARLARVSVSGTGLAGERVTLSDDAGRFTIAWLPAGDYQVSVSKPGYLTMFHGARRPGAGPGVPVHVDAGKPVIGIDITLPRGAVISGIVLDPLGAPAPGVRLQLQTFTRREGERMLTSAPSSGQSVTDDHGAYRLYGIRPGSYVLTAIPPSSGSNVELRQLSESEIRAAIADASHATPPPAGPRTIAPAPPGDLPVVQPAGRSVGFSPVYYPGTVREQEAVEFMLAPGQELDGIGVQLILVPAARLEGRIYGPNGQPAPSAQISLQKTTGSSTTTNSVRQQEGSFQIVGVPAGRYTLVASMEVGRPSAPGASGSAPGTYYAQQDIEVTGNDQSNLLLTLAPVPSFSGRVAFDGAPPSDMRSVRVQLEPVGGVNRSMQIASPDPSGAFNLLMMPGRYRLTAAVTPASNGPTWATLSSQVDGQDALVTPFEFRGDRPATNAIVTLTDHPAEVSGTLLDGADHPVAGMVLVMFPTDPSKWLANSSRVNRTTRSGADGTYRFSATLPGEYYLVVLTDLDANEWTDPAFKEQLVPAALKLTVGKGEKKVQNMKMAK